MRVTFVNPAMLFDPKDPFTTGVVYLPIGLASGAASMRAADHAVSVVDIFGLGPTNASAHSGMVRVGVADREFVRRLIATDPDLVVFYANQLLNHDVLVDSVRMAREAMPDRTFVVAENSQAVTAYQVAKVADAFFDVGVDYLIGGEMELRLLDLVDALEGGGPQTALDGVSTPAQRMPAVESIENLDALPFPAWELFPLDGYWSLRYGHGPVTEDRYLPILTSRGCPFSCRFCVVPATNNRRWRARSPRDVADEMAFLVDLFGVTEFHLEDLNPTISDARIRELAQIIISSDLHVTWKIVAGTKLESMKTLDTVRLMHQSGCRYVSISPESGSRDLRKKIGKPFDVDYARDFIRFCASIGIRTQTCFVVGFPEETDADRRMSLSLVRSLAWAGVSEIAVFVIAPVPGSAIYDDFHDEVESLSLLSFSPSWRKDYKHLSRSRLWMYANFLAIKATRHPLTIARQVRNFAIRRFETKMEMVPYRAARYRGLIRRASRGVPL